MSKLSSAQRARIVACLVEGNSLRATCRMTGAAMNTVLKLLVDLGRVCSQYQDDTLRELPCQRVQCDEVWAFVYAKAKNEPDARLGEYGVGDVWTWTAICGDCKLVPSWLVGERNEVDASAFVADLAGRLASRVQLTTDGHKPYLEAVEAAFGGEIDYAMLIEMYGPADPKRQRRYSPAVCTGIEVRPITGNPIPTTSPPATSSGRTSRCGRACDGSPG